VATRQGKCTNFGNCDTSNKQEVIAVPQGADFVCPECGRALTEVGGQAGKKSRTPVFVAALVVVVLIGLVIWRALNHGDGTTLGSRLVELRLSGSNTIGSSLAPSMAEAFLKSLGATDVHMLPGKDPEERTVEGLLPDKSKFAIRISAHGSATAFTDLAGNSCDIGMASRKIKSDESSKLSQLGDMSSPGNEHVLGLDGIAVIVNPGNPISRLEKDQIMKIFSGEFSDWSQVGAPSGAIAVYARDDKSGTWDTFKSLVLGDKSLVASAKRFEDSNALSDAVANDRNGIGFIGLPYVRSAKAIAVADKGAQPMLPTRLTVATEDYPLSRRLYLYTPANPQNQFTRKFVEFALSKQGQDVVGSSGFIAQNVTRQPQPAPKGARDEYIRLTQGAQRLSLDFRFRTGRSDLDNKAIVDVDRVVSFVADLKYTGNKILLFGFADSTGAREVNDALSLNRARTVEDQFMQRGLRPAVVRGFGSDLPVASNETAEGREKNRRVEIWVKE